MKKITLLVLPALLFMGFWVGVFSSPVQAFSGGSGVSGDPYVVLTADDLNRVRDDLDAHYIQGADIDLSDYALGSGWEPIGTSGTPFKGTFDGNHYRITGLVINSTASANIGFFGNTSQSTIQNVGLDDIDIKSSTSNANNLGGLAGFGGGTFINNYTSGSLEATGGSEVGGLIGELGVGTQISSSYSTVRVKTNTSVVGGLVGRLGINASIEKSYATGNISGFQEVGGLIGVTFSAIGIRDSYATGDVRINDGSAGGLLGTVADSKFFIRNSFAAGAVSGGTWYMGALGGMSSGARDHVDKSYWNKTANPSLPGMAKGTDSSVGLTESEIKQQASFDGFDFTDIWGINEGHSYPYLRVFAPVVQVDDLSPTPYQQGSTLTVTGEMRDGSIGQAVTVRYEILNHLGQRVVDGSQDFAAATGSYESYSFPVTLDETTYPGGNYTVNVMAEDADGEKSSVRSVTFSMPAIYYVKEDGASSNDGSSWANAFDSLQAALDVANAGDEIRIAKGTYYPTKEIELGKPRTVTFQMENGVAIYGGFAGDDDNETAATRDWKVNETILSGDLWKNDNPGSTYENKEDNAYHVFYHPDGTVNNTAVLDGVSIVGGNANSINSLYGGGMYNSNSHPVLTNVTLSGNTAYLGGGGMYNMNSNPILTDVILSNNRVGGGSGGEGGGLYNDSSNPVLTNVILRGNYAYMHGGGMYNKDSHPVLTNVTISGNRVHNSGNFGGGMYNWNSNPIIDKSIIWGSSSPIQNTGSSEPTFKDSIIEGSGGSGISWNLSNDMDQGGNLDVDPRFVDPKHFSDAPTLEGDYRLLPNSPAIMISEIMGALGVYESAGVPETKHTLIFEVDGVEVGREEVVSGEKATKPANPTKAGHTFAGWYKDVNFTTEWNFANGVTQDMTLYAKLTAANISVASVTLNPSKLNLTVGGITETLIATVNPSDATNQNVTWSSDNPTIASVDGNGVVTPKSAGTAMITVTTVDDGKTATSLVVVQNISSGGGTVHTYTLTFEPNGGSIVASQNLTYNEKAVNPTAPTKEGHTFAGWYMDKELVNEWDFGTGTVQNTILYAKWTPNSYILTFATNEGSTIAAQTLNYNEKAANPTAPTKEGDTFEGWYKEVDFTTKWDFATDVVKENTILYAKWTTNPPSCTANFTDTATHWAKEMIEDIASRCIIIGYPDGTFRPNEPIKRQHVSIMFTRAFELAPIRNSITFSDVPTNHVYYDAITQVYQAGIFDGASNGKFNPDVNMTRAQMAKVLVLAFGLESNGTGANLFRDVPSTHWAKDYISTLADNRIALGDNGDFKPDEPVTRAQFVAFMYRALNL